MVAVDGGRVARVRKGQLKMVLAAPRYVNWIEFTVYCEEYAEEDGNVGVTLITHFYLSTNTNTTTPTSILVSTPSTTYIMVTKASYLEPSAMATSINDLIRQKIVDRCSFSHHEDITAADARTTFETLLRRLGLSLMWATDVVEIVLRCVDFAFFTAFPS